MKQNQIKVGGIYAVKVNGRVCPVKVMEEGEQRTGSVYSRRLLHGGWYGINLETGKRIRIRSAAKCRYEIDPKYPRTLTPLGQEPRRTSNALQAAANKLRDEGLAGGVTDATMEEAQRIIAAASSSPADHDGHLDRQGLIDEAN